MSYADIGRKLTESERRLLEDHRERPYLLSWCNGEMTQGFLDELSAFRWSVIQTQHYGSVVTMTGPDHDYIACADGCGRQMRDGTGCRVGTEVLHPVCYAKHPAIVGATMAGILADEQQDEFNRSRR